MKVETALYAGLATGAGATLFNEVLNPHLTPFEKGLALFGFALFTTLAAVTGDLGAEKFKAGMRSNFNHRRPFFENKDK